MDLVPKGDSNAHTNDVVPSNAVKSNRKKRRAQYRSKKRSEAAKAVSVVYDPLASVLPSFDVIPSAYMRTSKFTPTLECIRGLKARNPQALSELPPPAQHSSSVPSRAPQKYAHPRTRIVLPLPSKKM